MVYELLGSNDYYRAIYEFGYSNYDNPNVFIPFNQVRILENNKNKVLYYDNTLPDWNHPIYQQANTFYINVLLLSDIDIPQQIIAAIYHDENDDPTYWDINYWYYELLSNSWGIYNSTFSSNFENYLINCYQTSFFLPVSPTSIYDINHKVGYGTSSIIDLIENIEFDFYLSNMNNNYPLNNDNSCGYVAMSILLSYYDTFLNGDIIYNNLNLITKTSITTPFLEDYESPGANDNFKSLLIDVAAYLNIYNPNDQNPLGLDSQEIATILNYYMSWFSDYQYNYSINQFNNLDDILTEIDSGYPVIIGIKDYVLCRNVTINNNIVYLPWYNRLQDHAMVAYGYEINLNGYVFLRCHTGWKDPNNTNNLSDVLVIPLDDNPIKGISLRLINNIHVHSNNYLSNGFGVCPCYFLQYVETDEIFKEIIEKLTIDKVFNYNKTYYIYNEGEKNEKE